MGKNFRLLSKQLLNSSSSASMNVDGSSTAVEFTLSPPSGVTFEVTDLILTIHSSGMDLATASELRVFGASGALTNGIKLTEKKGSPIVSVEVFPAPVKKIIDLYRYTSWSGSGVKIVGKTDGIAAGTDHLVATVSWPKPLTIRPNSLDSLVLTVQDDLSGLTLFEAHAVGTQYSITA
tara:strand:+ start:1326 stop:1859 length:534 start_codon:yes stop_codon:yes gene_type:complete